jgi:hypothetical protein
LYFSSDIIKMMKSRRIRWFGHVTHLDIIRNTYKILIGKSEGRDHLQDLGRDGG